MEVSRVNVLLHKLFMFISLILNQLIDPFYWRFVGSKSFEFFFNFFVPTEFITSAENIQTSKNYFFLEIFFFSFELQASYRQNSVYSNVKICQKFVFEIIK